MDARGAHLWQGVGLKPSFHRDSSLAYPLLISGVVQTTSSSLKPSVFGIDRSELRAPRVVLLLLEGEPEREKLSYLHARAEREGMSVEAVVMRGRPEVLERMLEDEQPTLFILCRTPSMTVGMRLWVERRFMDKAKPWQHMTTICTDLGEEYCWRGIAMHYRLLAEWNDSVNGKIARTHALWRKSSGRKSASPWKEPSTSVSQPITEYRFVSRSKPRRGEGLPSFLHPVDDAMPPERGSSRRSISGYSFVGGVSS